MHKRFTRPVDEFVKLRFFLRDFLIFRLLLFHSDLEGIPIPPPPDPSKQKDLMLGWTISEAAAKNFPQKSSI